MKNKLFLFLSLTVLVTVLVGLNVEDPWGSKTQTTDNQNNVVTPVHVSYGTPVYTDNFDAANDTTALKARGYLPYYRGTGPQGLTATWFTPSAPPPFDAFNGPTTGYVAANYNVVTAVNNIDSWLVLPRVTGGLLAGDSLYFYCRSSIGSTWPDSVRVMYSANDSVPEGSWTELGRFRTNVTTGWERKGFRAPAASVNGRFAIRYCVAGGGPSGNNSDFMGVDALTIERTAVARVWTEQTSGITASLYSVSAVSNDVAWACGATGKVVRTTNKGLTWTNVSGNIPATTPLYNIFAWDANLAICTGSPASGSFIYKTSNGGVNWITALTTTGGFDDNLWMTSATNAYCIGDAVGGNWHLVQSTNGGDNWSAWGAPMPTTNANGTYNNAAWFQGTQIWWSPVGESKMKYSSNMGTSWVDQTLPLANITATCFNSPTSGLAGGSSASTGVLRTTDAGTTWTLVPQTFVGTSSISGIAGTGSEYWVSLQATTIHYSSNNGTNWSLAYTAAAGSFYHLAESRTGNTIWGVRSNGAITRYGDPPTGVTPIGITVPDNFSLGQNYPNPFNPTTNIKFAVPHSGLVTIKVYDLLGKEITTLVNEVKNAGSYVVDFNASTLASGVYFYKMEVNGFREVKRMTLIK